MYIIYINLNLVFYKTRFVEVYINHQVEILMYVRRLCLEFRLVSKYQTNNWVSQD